MSEIHKELLNTARMDLDAVKLLTKNILIAPAIYFSGQVTEKSFKINIFISFTISGK